MHVSETTLTTKNNKRFLQQLKTGVNNSINCNNYRSKISTQAKNKRQVFSMENDF